MEILFTVHTSDESGDEQTACLVNCLILELKGMLHFMAQNNFV